MSNTSMQSMDNYDNAVIIRGAGGRKIGEIRPNQSYKDFLASTEIGPSTKFFTWIDVKHKVPVWKNPEAVVLWAWRQVLSCADDLKNNRMPSHCLICGERSINIRKVWPLKNRWIGVWCQNKKCSMYNVLIPSKMFYANNEDVPWDKLNESSNGSLTR